MRLLFACKLVVGRGSPAYTSICIQVTIVPRESNRWLSYERTRTLRHMKRVTKDTNLLVKIYACYLRPVIEYLSVVYGPLLSNEESNIIEKMQTSAHRIVYGNSVSYLSLIHI